jgi:hypothetical protein
MRFVAVLLLLLVGAGSIEPGAAPLRAEPVRALHVKAVLVAAERSIKAFDNAADRFASALAARVAPDTVAIARFSNRPIPGTERSEQPEILRAIETMQAAPNESCLIYVTGHGSPNKGVALPRSDDYLGRNQLDQAIARGCGNRPTVVVISACFSGRYATGRIARDNRIVLTAARADRPSFGCGVRDQFTYFDGCFLTAFEDKVATTWEDVARSATACVAQLERASEFTPSEPQLFVGRAVTGLKLPGAGG